jgi:uncharacterized protein
MAISFTGSYTQNFDTLPNSGAAVAWANNSTLAGWYLFRQPSTGTAVTTIETGAGTSTTGSFYSFGAAASTERALGGLGSGGAYFGSPATAAVAGWIGFGASNGTGQDLTTVTVTFNGEQWRNGGNTTAQSMVLQYGFGTSFTAVTTWTAAGTSFNWTSPVATATGAAVDGNVAGLVAGVGGALTLNQSWTAGSTLWFRWIENNDSGNDHGLAIDNFSLSAVVAPPASPTVNLSLNTNSASEAAQTLITVTATASASQANAQTVTLSLAGTGITTGDTITPATLVITIPAGQTTGSLSFNIADDATVEAAETLVVSIASVSSGLTLGATTSANVSIADNTGSLLTLVGSATSATASEIPAFDPISDRLYVVAATVVNVYSVSGTGTLTALGNLVPGFTAPTGFTAAPNSVAVMNGVVAVAWEIRDSVTGAHSPGRVSFHNAADGSFLNVVTVGALPDMLTFTPDGSKLLVANEGEPNSYGQATSFDPEGSISIIDLAGGVAAATVATAGFTGFNLQVAALKAAGVRIYGPGATVAQDLEPEYITVSADGNTAWVTLQEANALALVDIATATVTQIIPLGLKNHNLAGNGLDASDQDSGAINIANWPVLGMYQPDAIASYVVGGQTYTVMANEGDSRSYTGFNEEIRVGNDGYVLDPTVFPNAAALKQNANLGRLQVTNASGDIDGDGDFDQIHALGSRSFSIRDAAGNLVWDSGDMLEQLSAARMRALFNSEGTASGFDSRSDNKGPEPEGLVLGQVGSRTYAFIGLERTGDVVVFDISNPVAPSFVQWINLPQDRGVEGLAFVSAANSPTGKPLLITAAETSNTVTVYEIAVPLRIADIQGAAHISPRVGQAVAGVPGIVTALASNGFYMQDPQPDNNPATSEAIFVFTSVAPTVTVGQAVRVSGTVSEFRPSSQGLTQTEITSPVISAWTEGVGLTITPVVIGTDRTPPTSVIASESGNVETTGTFNPAVDGIDFWESLEGMLVQVNNPVAVSPTLGGAAEEIWVLANNGAGATGVTARGGIGVSAGDFNPERIQLDDMTSAVDFPSVDVGARLSNVTGVIGYDGSNFELRLTTAPTVVQASTLTRETTALVPGTSQLTVATFNVENLDPNDGAAKFANIAAAIVNNLKAPDILSLEEVQDNNGATNDSVVDASVTLQALVNAIVAAGGPTYQWQQINPVDDTNGGEPGGNIRNVFLYNPLRVDYVPGSVGLIDPGNAAFNNSRKPLVAQFDFNGERVTLVSNHFVSKGGDDPLFGSDQPPILSSEATRTAQATVVKTYVQALLTSDPNAKVLVLGDLNDFEFSAPLTVLESAGLTSLVETLPANERYTYNFQGNAQALDHILASANLLGRLAGYDVVHINSEFLDQVSDHDPVVASFNIVQGVPINGTVGRDNLVGGAGADTIIGGQGRDVLTGGAGADKFVYKSLLDAGDQITDFVVGLDKIVITDLLTAVMAPGGDPVALGIIRVSLAGVGTALIFDPDGSAGPAVGRTLVDLVGVAVPNPMDLLGTLAP